MNESYTWMSQASRRALLISGMNEWFTWNSNTYERVIHMNDQHMNASSIWMSQGSRRALSTGNCNTLPEYRALLIEYRALLTGILLFTCQRMTDFFTFTIIQSFLLKLSFNLLIILIMLFWKIVRFSKANFRT